MYHRERGRERGRERKKKEKKLKKMIAQLLSSQKKILFFVNCQRHKYFVLLFVPFCKKMKKKKKKKKEGKESVVSKRVFPNTVQSMRSLADRPCNIDAEPGLPVSTHVLLINK